MSKSNTQPTPPNSNPATDPFKNVPPVNPFGPSPLASTGRAFAPRINVVSVEEQQRAQQVRAGKQYAALWRPRIAAAISGFVRFGKTA